MEKVNIKKIIERSGNIEGDLKDNSIDDFLDIEEEERGTASDMVEVKLRNVHDKDRHGDVETWTKTGPFGAEVFEKFDLDIDIFEELVDERTKRDMSQIVGEVQERGLDGSDSLSNVRGVVSDIFDDFESIKANVSVDDYLWVCEGFLRMGEEEVELERFIGAHYLFQKNLEHKANSASRNTALMMKDRFPDVFDKSSDLKERFRNLFGSR